MTTPTIEEVLDEVVVFVDRFVSMSSEQLDALALWVVHTHLVDQFDVCAYLFITSPAKRCGKSLLLDVLERLVCRGRSTANISPAALFRMLDEVKPTLMFDEVDNIFSKGGKTDPTRSELTGLINAGFRKGRPAWRMGGQNMRQLQQFDAFGPKALAGIGTCLPDTTADRCIPITLERKAKNVLKERYRIRIHEDQARDLRTRIELAAIRHDDLGTHWPDLPNELNDRQQDIWECLLAVADAAGGFWPKRARRAAVALHSEQADDSTATQLLEDLRRIFRPVDDDTNTMLPVVEKMLTKDIAARLNALDEAPWSAWRGGMGVTSTVVAGLLKPFGLKSEHIRVGHDRGRGFTIGMLEPVFASYLDVDAVDTVDETASAQVRAVNTSMDGSVDADVDADDLGISADVNAVNTDNGGARFVLEAFVGGDEYDVDDLPRTALQW